MASDDGSKVKPAEETGTMTGGACLHGYLNPLSWDHPAAPAAPRPDNPPDTDSSDKRSGEKTLTKNPQIFCLTVVGVIFAVFTLGELFSLMGREKERVENAEKTRIFCSTVARIIFAVFTVGERLLGRGKERVAKLECCGF